MTYGELVYMVLDALKIHSDDAKFTEDHVIFLLNKYRAYALQQRYSKSLDIVNNANYQTIHIIFEKSSQILSSRKQIPSIMNIALPKAYFGYKFTLNPPVFVSEDRFRYVGNNRFLNNIIYYTIGLDSRLYLKCENLMDDFYVTAVFEDPLEVISYDGYDGPLNDRKYPIEDNLIPGVLELVLKDLTNGLYKPSDTTNDAQDALSDLAGFLRRNMKSQFQKQIDE